MTESQSPNCKITKSNIYRCVILAAGMSTRLRPLTESKPKCLIEIGDVTILESAINNLLKIGIIEIAIVTGYHGEMIREFIKQNFPQLRIRFILNPNYTTTNNAYSLLLSKRFLENEYGKIKSGLLLLDSDILFSPTLLPFLLSNEAPDKIAVRVSGNHNEEEIRVETDSAGNIVMIGKETPLSLTYGESIGIEVFSTETTAKLFAILEQRIRSGLGRTEFYEASFQDMIDCGVRLKAVDVSDFPAIEIDTLEDLQLADRMSFD